MTKKQVISARVHSMEALIPDVFLCRFESEFIAQTALPGQFVSIAVGDADSPLLRRPISICGVDRALNLVSIIFMVKALGTRLMARILPGSYMDILGPLGNAFTIPPSGRKLVAVGGGIGIFPLLFLLEELAQKNMDTAQEPAPVAVLGFRDRAHVLLEKEFSSVCDLMIYTDDGSYGESGLVTQGLKTMAHQHGQNCFVAACGPTPMLKAVQAVALDAGVSGEISMEQRMGCTIGACLVCACKVKQPDSGTKTRYAHVCKDGPVFDLASLVFDQNREGDVS